MTTTNNTSRNHRLSLRRHTERLITGLRASGRLRTAETYTTALNSLLRFIADPDAPVIRRPSFSAATGDLRLDRITSELMQCYEGWLRSRGVVPNSISFYLRILRAIYNRAVEEGLIRDRSPFRHVYTGIAKTVKRALPIEAIRRIRSLDLSPDSPEAFARDMFMMSFMLRGMSFVDMAFLRKSDLCHGTLTYSRRKTGQTLRIAWTADMQSILERYPENESDYLLPIIRRRGLNERAAYRNAGYNINRSLKRIGGCLGLDIPLTLYVARHSWASAARAKGVPLSVISEGMGHDSEKTTRIYLADLDTSAVDRANDLILNAL